MYAMAMQSDGRLIIGGSFNAINGAHHLGLARINPDGSVDPSWNPSIGGVVLGLAIIDNDIYVGGEFQSASGFSRQNLARISLTGDGSPDQTWLVNTGGGFGQGRVSCVASDGANLYVGGDFTFIGGQGRAGVAKIAPAGSASVSAWNPNLSVSIGMHSIIPSGGDVYLGGYMTSGQLVAKVNASTGAPSAGWNPSTFAGSGTISVQKLALDSNGGVYAVGSFTSVGGVARDRAVKLSGTTGVVDTNWNANISGSIAPGNILRSVFVDSGFVYIAGDFLSAGGLSRGGFARTNTTTGAVDAAWAPRCDKFGYSIFAQGDSIYLGGDFRQISGATALGVAKVDPNVGSPIPEYVVQAESPGLVKAMARQPDGKLVIGGQFYLAEGLRRQNIARLNADGTLDRTWAPGANLDVLALAISGTDIFVGGEFTNFGGVARNRLAKLSTIGSDTPDPNWDPNADNGVDALVVNNGSVFVGGVAFTHVGGASRARLAKISATGSGAADPAWQADTNGDGVGGLVVNGGQLYATGHFTVIGGVARNCIARLSLTSGAVDPTWNPSFPSNAYLGGMAFNGTDLFIGGQFGIFSGNYHQNFAKITTLGNGALDDTWVVNTDSIDHTVTYIAVSGGFVYTGGNFFSLKGQSHRGLARVNITTGIPDSTWQKDVALEGSGGDNNPIVFSLLVEGQDLLAGGAFTSINSVNRTGFAWLL